MPQPRSGATDLACHWSLDPAVTFLNHGSFGACPRPVLAEQARLRRCLEAEPVVFLWREIEDRLDAATADLAAFLHCRPTDLVFLPNATTGVNTVLQRFPFRPGDEILALDHGYPACLNAAAYAATRADARLVTVRLPFPVAGPEEVRKAVAAGVTPRTRLALLDHVTSPTALVLPIAELVRDLAARGVDTLVDGAHAPGMFPLDLAAVGAAFYTGNLHKWVGAPKGAAFLHVREDRQDLVRPLVISHGATSRRTDRSRFRLEFDWTGTDDPTPFLAVPAALRFLETLIDGGFPRLAARNRLLALAARDLLADRLGIAPPCPDEMVGTMAALPLPPGRPEEAPRPPRFFDTLQDRLFTAHRIEVPVMNFPAFPARLVRVSAQAYNRLDQYERLADALDEELRPVVA